eukprot:8017412-Pyramimonas_sp.AAC.1
MTDFDDWPLSGARTTERVCREMVKTAEGPRAQRSKWLSEAKIPNGDRSVHEGANLALGQELAARYDGLNVMNLARMEAVARRR